MLLIHLIQLVEINFDLTHEKWRVSQGGTHRWGGWVDVCVGCQFRQDALVQRSKENVLMGKSITLTGNWIFLKRGGMHDIFTGGRKK